MLIYACYVYKMGILTNIMRLIPMETEKATAPVRMVFEPSLKAEAQRFAKSKGMNLTTLMKTLLIERLRQESKAA